MPAVWWLDDEEQEAWRAFLDATRLLFDRLDRELQRRSQISHADYEILVRLSEAPGRRMRMSELAARTQFSRSRLSHAVGRLEEAGWVTREDCPTDRRGAFAVLTDAGWEALRQAAPGHVGDVRHLLFDRLSREQVRALAAISRALAEGDS